MRMDTTLQHGHLAPRRLICKRYPVRRSFMSFVSLKHGEVYSVTNQYGDMDEALIGTGIYYKDTRFLKRYVMKINQQPCIFF
ncbi:hypothetical protein E1I69_05430 [Bacillus timonensis]|uniref:Putative glycogen debranching enzyme N-terminal domain-containing protein n=2 Tax=Bacillus timonensis TaxID=1033734 RepID=A0A4S3PW46_9BACI|nr:hypothetical protein E1I69_05430 [Bacillus timonensis]